MTLDLKALRDGVVQFGSAALSSARVLTIIDTALAAIAERDALLEEGLMHTTKELASAVATARAVAVAEACEKFRALWEAGEGVVDLRTIEQVRALAPLEASLVAVPKETLEKVISCLKLGGSGVVTFRDALTALSAEVMP